MTYRTLEKLCSTIGSEAKMVADVQKTNPTIKEVIEYVNSCDLMYINEKKYTKSIYFKDSDDNITYFIYSLSEPKATILATINNVKHNLLMSREEFYKVFNKHRIFISK